MSRDPRYDILFEPVPIGPVVARNRFYQVPHCNGMGHRMPREVAAMRGIKAEGGWAVVSTEECTIHPSSDLSPDVEGRLWDDGDIAPLALMTEAVHRHGALAAIQLVHNGPSCANLHTRQIPLAPGHQVVHRYAPVQARAMDKADIRQLQRWHRDATLRARQAGFDIICVYAGHDLSLPMHFLQRRRNPRSDEYGGSLENRVRLLRELIEQTHEAVGDTCAVAVRLAVDELLGPAGITCAEEGREILEMLAELPDLWDVNVSNWANDSVSSRFAQEGYQEKQVAFVKHVTSKPVVGVGRFTSPDSMVSQVRRGVLDFIGAARPSIADPFLPRKIEQGRMDEIRECIGCNVCISGDFTATPIRCTQNPTMGEEDRRGWHPERVAPRGSDLSILVVGAGPAGLECACTLARRGYRVSLAEATRQLGGRVAAEAKLPGLAEWRRVLDHRELLLKRLPNVEQYRESRVTLDDVLAFGPDVAVIATGACWRGDGVGRANALPVITQGGDRVLTPDDIMAGAEVSGPVVIFDDDHYYMASVLAELLRSRDLPVHLVTPAPAVAAWTANTLEQKRVYRRLLERGVTLQTGHNLVAFEGDRLQLRCVFTDEPRELHCGSLVTVTARLPRDRLKQELEANIDMVRSAGVHQVAAIGDCFAPGTIAAAIYSGHQLARAM